MAALDKMATVAHHVQDDFDLQEGQMAEVELQDRDENLVCTLGLQASSRVWHFRQGFNWVGAVVQTARSRCCNQ